MTKNENIVGKIRGKSNERKKKFSIIYWNLGFI